MDGLYTANPGRDPGAKLIPEVTKIDARIRAMADGGSASGMGSGGMISKLEAARIAQAAGAHLAIVSGHHPRPLTAFGAGGRGTVFVAEKGASARKAWLAGRLTSKGRIHVDAGAAKALASGRSLLAAGATSIEGRFARGDVIDIIGPGEALIARGLVEYDTADAVRIVGHRSDELAAILGYAPRGALVHRDHMVTL